MPIVDITYEKLSSISKMDLNRKDSKHESDYEGQKSLVYCTGKDVYHYLMTSSDSFVDRRSYKGGALPSTLKISYFKYVNGRQHLTRLELPSDSLLVNFKLL